MRRKIFKLLILIGVFLLLVTACNGAEEGPAEVPAAEGADVEQAAILSP